MGKTEGSSPQKTSEIRVTQPRPFPLKQRWYLELVPFRKQVLPEILSSGKVFARGTCGSYGSAQTPCPPIGIENCLFLSREPHSPHPDFPDGNESRESPGLPAFGNTHSTACPDLRGLHSQEEGHRNLDAQGPGLGQHISLRRTALQKLPVPPDRLLSPP